MLMLAFTLGGQAPSKDQHLASVSVASVGALLAGRYDNSAQVARGNATAEKPAPQHVIVSIEPTPLPGWQLWRVHMDVDPAVAQAAGSDTSLEAVWAMNISQAEDKSVELIPYTLRPSVSASALDAATFDAAQWLSLEACALRGHVGSSRFVAQVAVDEMCVAEAMGLGGKRAFLPSWVERTGDQLSVQIIYSGQPWRVEAIRVAMPSTSGRN